jgi:hypothetical protein
MRLQTVIMLALLSGTVFAQDAPDAGDPASIHLPTQMCRGFYFLPVTLSAREGYPEDRTLWFLYDTGAGSTYVDPDSLLRVTGRDIDSNRVTLVDATTGPLTFNRLPARLGELDHLSKALGREIDGILAFSVFGDFLMTLDYQAGEIRLDEGALPAADDVTVFDASGRDDRPWLSVDFGDQRRRMLIDSGAALSGLVVRSIGRYDTQSPPRATGASMRLRAVERREGARATGDAMLGPHTLLTPTLQSTPGTELIGGQVMHHFTWTFDQRNERVRLVRTDPDRPIQFGPMRGHGMVLAPDPVGLRVHDIIANSPASQVDIQTGDIVTHFDGQPLLDRDCDAPGGTSLQITIRRGEEELEFELDLFALVE